MAGEVSHLATNNIEFWFILFLLASGNWVVVGGSAVGGRVDATFPNLAKFPGSFHFRQRREERVLVRR